MADLYKATVTVVAREGFHGFWSAKRHFQNGENLVEVTAEEAKAIEADAALGLPVAIVPGWPPPPPKTEEELAAEAAAAEKAKADAAAAAKAAEEAELAALEAEEQAAAEKAKAGRAGKAAK